MPVISVASSVASWAPSRRVGRQRSEAMSSSATTAAQRASPTTPAATAIARSVRGWRVCNGSPPGRPSCCRFPTSTSSSPCRRKRARSPSRTTAVYAILVRAAAETLGTIAADPRHLGAQVGVTAVLHTWGQTLQHHPHIHCVVPGGGPSLDGTRWVACLPSFFLPVRVLSRLFRRLFLQGLQNAFDAGKLRFFGNLAGLADPTAFTVWLHELRRINWVVYAKPPFGGPQQVLAYLGRYTHRVAIANSRLISLSDDKVRFTWKDYRQDGKTKTMALDADEFIRRFLLHALPDSFHRIRYYGFLANGGRSDNIARCRRLLDARDTDACEPADNRPKGDRPLTATDFAICPDCSGTMRRTATVPRFCNAAPFSCDTS
jgi:hypothetical protein